MACETIVFNYLKQLPVIYRYFEVEGVNSGACLRAHAKKAEGGRWSNRRIWSRWAFGIAWNCQCQVGARRFAPQGKKWPVYCNVGRVCYIIVRPFTPQTRLSIAGYSLILSLYIGQIFGFWGKKKSFGKILSVRELSGVQTLKWLSTFVGNVTSGIAKKWTSPPKTPPSLPSNFWSNGL